MTTWFTADLHLLHKNILNYCNRPWAIDARNPTTEEAREMTRALVRNWNEVVKSEDDVYDLGDLAYACDYEDALQWIRQLKGRHHFIEGNHDRNYATRRYREAPSLFTSFYSSGYVEVEVQGQAIVLCHYAMREWHHALRGVWHLFGHTHAELPPFGKSVDVGVDNSANIAPGAHYRPVSFEEVKTFMDRQPIGPHAQFEHFPRKV
jgi:calcineurin-like phosphoesterase family protein